MKILKVAYVTAFSLWNEYGIKTALSHGSLAVGRSQPVARLSTRFLD